MLQITFYAKPYMSSDTSIIDCGDALTVANAADMHQKLQAALNNSSTINLKADEVEKVDTAGLQLFVALSKEIERVSGEVIWQQPSDSLKQAAVTLGLTNAIGLHS